MKIRNPVIAIAMATALSATGALAQHAENHTDQAAPAVTAMDRSDAGKAGGMMSGGMLMGQNEIGKIVEQLIQSFAAIQAEKDPTAIKAKLVQHGALLKELQAKVQDQAHMMDVMQHMMVGSMMDGIMMDGKMMDGKTISGKMMGGGENKK